MRTLLLAVAILLMIGSVCAIPVCGNQRFYLSNDTSDVAGYFTAKNSNPESFPGTNARTITKADGATLLAQYITPPFTHATLVEPSIWGFTFYDSTDSPSENTSIAFTMSNITSDRQEWSFPGFVSSRVSDYNITKSHEELVIGGSIFFAKGDRLAVRAYVSTESTIPVTATLWTGGDGNITYVSGGYFDCASDTYNTNGGLVGNSSSGSGMILGFAGGLVASLLVYMKIRKNL